MCSCFSRLTEGRVGGPPAASPSRNLTQIDVPETGTGAVLLVVIIGDPLAEVNDTTLDADN